MRGNNNRKTEGERIKTRMGWGAEYKEDPFVAFRRTSEAAKSFRSSELPNAENRIAFYGNNCRNRMSVGGCSDTTLCCSSGALIYIYG